MNKIYTFLILILIVGTFHGLCDFDARIAKWYDNHAAAISLTYDDGYPVSKLNRRVNRFMIENGMCLEYELVTRTYRRSPFLKKFLLEKMIPSGLGYFGHGDTHVNHDQLTYEEALASFARCNKTMKEFGLKTVAYAYPHGKGREAETKKALAEAGFLSGRLHFSRRMTNPYIIPGSKTEPDDWFGLPTVVMRDYSFDQCERCVSNNEQLIPYLDNTLGKTAWIILTYHAIGNEKGYGFFKFDEFQKNIFSIKERDFWNASMNAVTLYIRERAVAKVKMEVGARKKKKIKKINVTLSDGLPNDLYDQPLTILFKLPASWVKRQVALVENGKTVKTMTFESTNAKISLKPDEIERKLVLKK